MSTNALDNLPNGNQNPDGSCRIAIVDGDVIVDCHIASNRNLDKPPLWHIEKEKVPVINRPGGAALLGELIYGIAEKLKTASPDAASWEVVYRKIELPDTDKRFPHLYAIWHQYERSLNKRPLELAWRISQFVGTQPTANHQTPDLLLEPETRPNLIVLDDKGREFRDDRYWWSQYTSPSSEQPWFLIRRGRPLDSDDLWQGLLNSHGSRLIAVTTADDIRQREVFVGRYLSWERTAQDLYSEFVKSAALSQFKGCAFIVVCFTSSAAVLIENHPATSEDNDPFAGTNCWLVYDSDSLENEEWRDQKNGLVQGSTYCVMAAITRALLQSSSQKPEAAFLTEAIRSGLNASRSLYLEGFKMEENVGIIFPLERTIRQIVGEPEKPVKEPEKVVEESEKEPEQTWGIVQVQPPRDQHENWTIFEEQVSKSDYPNVEALAKEIAVIGIDTLGKEMPVFKVGDLAVADRREIEGYRSIQRVLKEYVAQKHQGIAPPLSIGVFGPPGSGKSFGIKQLAEHSVGDADVEYLPFNLSQLNKPDDLRGAFHQIRDASLRGKFPLVFWDEFDSILQGQTLGWLRYFLAPMQDGVFQEDQITHPIGRAFFVFAGGTKYTMRDFLEAYVPPEKETNGKELPLKWATEATEAAVTQRQEEAKKNKAPDFVSRLRGYLDILGLNPSPDENTDSLYTIRRAIVLNAHLKKYGAPRGIIETNGSKKKEGFSMDKGVIKALLEVSNYRYGARSMEAIISMSLLSGRNRFERSSLPSTAQLKLHVDADDFISLLTSA
jgi:hypothetical protein